MRSKELTSLALITAGGLALGLVVGFLVANWTWKGDRAAPQAQSQDMQSQLPPGHPEIGQAGGEPQLPPGHPDIGQGAEARPTAVEMPSLEPLPPSSREKRAEQQYKNIQVLRGIPADRLQSIMESFSAALGVNCTYCHIKGQEEKDDKQAKQVARKMIRLTLDVNKQIGGLGRVTCYTCHRGQPRPAS
jgi:hypothetical protein